MSLINDPSGFGVTTSLEGRKAVLILRGRVESLAAFDFWAALAGAIELDRDEVVLDVSELSFIGAAGLVALANAEKNFAEAGVELTIRTPSPTLRRVLGAMEPTEVDRLDQALARLGHLGREQIDEPTHPPPPITQLSKGDLRRLAAIPTDSD